MDRWICHLQWFGGVEQPDKYILGYDLPDCMTRQNISADMICGGYVLAPAPALFA